MRQSDAPLLFRKRYWVSFLSSVGVAFFMILRANLSIALVEMTSDKKIELNNETIIQVSVLPQKVTMLKEISNFSACNTNKQARN